MMRRIFVAAVVAIGLSLFALPASAAEDTPTFNQHVGQILLDNCASCHRPNQVAPMSLLTYDEARPWARAIKAKVESREMPPWFADLRFGNFSNDTSLSEDEIATIVAWANGGAPQGDGVSPEPPMLSEGGGAILLALTRTMSSSFRSSGTLKPTVRRRTSTSTRSCRSTT